MKTFTVDFYNSTGHVIVSGFVSGASEEGIASDIQEQLNNAGAFPYVKVGNTVVHAADVAGLVVYSSVLGGK